jgi:hypothetical protein
MMNHSRVKPGGFKPVIAAIITAWFMAVLGLSLPGVFSRRGPHISDGAAVVLPVAVFAFWYLSSPGFRRFILASSAIIFQLVEVFGEAPNAAREACALLFTVPAKSR